MSNSEVPQPQGPTAGTTGFRLRRVHVILCLLGVFGTVAAVALWLRPAPAPPPQVPAEEDDLDQVLSVVNPGYVGIDVCAECHAQRAAVFRGTRHYLACRPASDAAAPGFSSGRGVFVSRSPGLRFEMSRSGNDLFATGIQRTARGEDRVTHQIGLVYGAASKRDEMYFAWQEDKLYHLPVAWLYPLDGWGHGINSIRGRETPPSCLECHNTWIGHVPGTANQYHRDGMLLGVTCERCHGPGREHTEYHRAHPNDAAHAILHPGTLNRDRLMDLCAQCHANPRPRGRAFAYRPGEPLAAYYHDVKTNHPEDDTTNQVRYLGQSKCFQKSEMTCITCHDPHRSKPAHGGCAKCHTPEDCKDQYRLPEAVRGDCVGCHMPPRVWMHVHFYTTPEDEYVPIAPRADHRIGVYPEARKAVLLNWLRTQKDASSTAEAERFVTQLQQYWVKEADQRRRDARFKGAIGAYREALKVAPDPMIRQQLQDAIARQAELDELINAVSSADRSNPQAVIPILKKILEIKPDFAYAHAELGSIYATLGRREEAVTHLEAVAQSDPNDSYGVTMLASMAYFEGRFADAVALCRRAHEIDAGHATNHYIWGLALLKQDRVADAEKQFRNTLLSNPTHGGGNMGLSECLRRQGQTAEAVRYARIAVRWSDERNVEVRLNLADAYLAANRPAEAKQVLEQALTVAEGSNPGLVPEIHTRLRGLR